MKLVTETRAEKQKVLIVDKYSLPIADILKKELSKYDNDIFISPQMQPSVTNFTVCYILTEKFNEIKNILQTSPQTKVVFIFFEKKIAVQVEAYLQQFYVSEQYKCIYIDSQILSAGDLEKILWFTFTSTKEKLLTITTQKIQKSSPSIPQIPVIQNKVRYARKKRSVRRIVVYILILVGLLHILFFPFLILSNVFFYSAVQSVKDKKIDQASTRYKYGQSLLNTSKKTYSLVRPTFQILSLAVHTDNLIQFDDSVSFTLQKGILLSTHVDTFSTLLLKKDKSDLEVRQLRSLYQTITNDLDSFSQYLTILIQKMPNLAQLDKTKERLEQGLKDVQVAQSILAHFDTIMAKDTEKKYLILFANNMELRPGGGFIGSFGVVKVHNYSIDPIKIYDVYDADGQLTTHVDPPEPIRLYLQQPNWFLRDSAFSPDFETNYKQAKFFLSQELQMNEFDGAVLLTTTTIQHLLEAMDEIYIPDFKETVNKDNFYIKAQLYAEKDFFPGSTKKKRFLGSVTDQMMTHLESASSVKLLEMLKKSLEEKQMVMYFEDAEIQDTINTLYWSGQAINPTCPEAIQNCINNYLFPYEANLGVNKANFFIKKLIALTTEIREDGVVDSSLEITIKNESMNSIFPGGTYKNYFQLILPQNADVNTITKNGTLIESYDTRVGLTKTIGFFLEIPPQASTKIRINYLLENNIEKGKSAYQLVMQKQIGSPNSEFHLKIKYPENVYATPQNFSPLVKNNTILYNTTLTADKIFFIELLKE